MKHLFKYFRHYKADCFFSPFFKLLEACFDLLVPIVISRIIDEGIQENSNSYILQNCLWLLLLAGVGFVLAVSAQYFAARAATGFSAEVRKALFVKLQSFSYRDTDSMGVSSMITRLTSDINQLQSGVNMTLRLFLRSPVIVFGAVVCAFFINVDVAWIFVIAVPLLAAAVFLILLSTLPLYQKVQKSLDTVTERTRENFNGVRVIRAFRDEEAEIRQFDEANRTHVRLMRFAGRISALLNPLTYVLINLGIVAVIYAGGIQVNIGNLSTGQVVALFNYMSQILVELIKLANQIINVTKSVACGNRIGSVLTMETGLDRLSEDECPSGSSEYAVEFSDVSLRYSEGSAPALRDISFTVLPGETVGIIGGTGSGKSSLVNLIPRFYDRTDGSVRVGGHDVRTLDPEALRDGIGIVPQKPVLFKGTIRSNLCWGKENATDEELWAALDVAQAREFVETKEGGLDAPVEQNGGNFSGGQRQRLTIARALVGKPSILILDDSASALDFATEAALRKALRNLDYTPTVFIISQRTSSIRHADRILVLDDGVMVGSGRHEDLLESCPVYREIELSQTAVPGGAS